ncbi:SulP family inorganic anion transporter [Amycolatopsis sp. NPDC051903]|uniref:SulP family inorganic anion transporter n=1 Tax=Amycolatopsis sp. NPDC051903 TaxID=3363936 RepID=UPI0037BB039A
MATAGALIVYAIFGWSSCLSVGPKLTTTLVTAAVLAPVRRGDPAHYATLAAVLAVVVDALCLVAGLARLGVVAELLSKPVLTGYRAGIAVLMVVGLARQRHWRSRLRRSRGGGCVARWPTIRLVRIFWPEAGCWCFSVGGKGSRTVLGSAAGSRTQLSSLVALGTVVFIVCSCGRCWHNSRRRLSTLR